MHRLQPAAALGDERFSRLRSNCARYLKHFFSTELHFKLGLWQCDKERLKPSRMETCENSKEMDNHFNRKGQEINTTEHN